eukprot:6214507-Pleurochrysis_carterae.AAC.2
MVAAMSFAASSELREVWSMSAAKLCIHYTSLIRRDCLALMASGKDAGSERRLKGATLGEQVALSGGTPVRHFEESHAAERAEAQRRFFERCGNP